MMVNWEAETLVRFADLLLPEDVDAYLMRDFCNPALKDTLLLYGPPGTGKSVLCAAIAAERTGAQSLADLMQNIWHYDCKERQVRDSITGERLSNALNASRCFNDAGAIFIFDEIDELTDGQQKELTAFINFANKATGVTIFATTNVDLRKKAAAAKKLQPALLSRFSYRQFIGPQPAVNFLPVVQQKLTEAGVERSDAEVLAYLEGNFEDELVDFRQLRPLLNQLLRRLSDIETTSKHTPAVLRVVC